MSLTIPMVWWEGNDHDRDSYFRMINLKGINHQNNHHVQYPNVLSAIRPIPHGQEFTISDLDGNMWCCSDSEHVAADDTF